MFYVPTLYTLVCTLYVRVVYKKAIATQIHDHLINNDIVANFQSAYKAGHSCETALLYGC